MTLAGLRIGVTAARKAEEQIALLERRGAQRRVGPGAVARPAPGRRGRPARRHQGGAGRAGRHLPGDHRRRDADVVRGGRPLGAAAGPARRTLGAPRSWPADRRASGRCARRGLRERWAPESECFDDVMAELRAARPVADCGSCSRSTGSRWRPRRTSSGGAAPRSEVVRSTGCTSPRTRSRCGGWPTWSRTGSWTPSRSPPRRPCRR